MPFSLASLPFLAAAVSGAVIESRQSTVEQFHVTQFAASYTGQWTYNFYLVYNDVPGTRCRFTDDAGKTAFSTSQQFCDIMPYAWSIGLSTLGGGNYDFSVFYTDIAGSKYTGVHTINGSQLGPGTGAGSTVYTGETDFTVNATVTA